MTHDKHDFDGAAAHWDLNPGRVKLASDIARAIREEVPLTADMDVLDFGCGTGLVTLALQPSVRSITGVDSSRGMLAILGKKIEAQNLGNVKTLLLDLEAGDVLKGRYHLIVSSMTLHHVEHVEKLLAEFYRAACPQGYLCIADLDLDDGRFHDDSTGVIHNGFDRAVLRKLFIAAGFEQVRDCTAVTITKATRDGATADFSVFLMIGRKGREA